MRKWRISKGFKACQNARGAQPKTSTMSQKFILRNFLSNPDKEQVSVFSKKSKSGFRTSIKNIMAERRFYEFRISKGYIASFEGGMGRIEDVVLPEYRRLIQNRTLTSDPECRGKQALLIAFQSLRTRAMRDTFEDMETQISAKLEQMGGSIEQLEGYTPPDTRTID